MPLELKVINIRNYPEWDSLISMQKEYSFFQSSAWAHVLADTYNYKPLYFTLFDRQKLLVLMPFMEVKSFLASRRGVSLPFSDYCDFINNASVKTEDIIQFLINYGEKAKWKYFETRGGTHMPVDLTPAGSFYCHTLNFNGNEDLIFCGFRDSTQRNIKKSIKENVVIKISHTWESLQEYYRLHCITRKKHGVPPQPHFFFKKIFEHIISQEKGFVALAIYNDIVIAGNIYFCIHKKAYYKFGASDQKYQELRATNLIMWESIRWLLNNGFESLCFGRTDMNNQGLLQFKRGWGAEEKTINYYKYDFNAEIFIKSASQNKYIISLMRYMPVSILKLLGSLSYKHMG